MLTLTSDHQPIEHRIYINFNKADWNGFAEVTGSTFAALPTLRDVHVGERNFRKAIAAAAAGFIPAECIRETPPSFPAEVAVLADERDNALRADLGNPCIRDLNMEIRQLVNQHRR